MGSPRLRTGPARTTGRRAAAPSAEPAGTDEPAAGPTGTEFEADASADTAAEPSAEPDDPFAEAETTTSTSASAEADEGGDDIESLFGDMGSTLEALEDGRRGRGPEPTQAGDERRRSLLG
ncbi:MAG: hypothetical protein U5K37_06800 [Natrialbaceae archaeon]|nr:hypothetical protein [Natrialbaceae archaeon]